MAMALDAHFSKADLMNAYINEIFLGQDGDRAIHGFGLASQFYFGKPLAELDLAEVALMVAIVRGPSYYDPRRHADRARARRDLVLKVMADQGIVKRRRGAARRSAAARGHRAPGGGLLPRLPRLRAAHAAPRLPRAGSDRGGPAHLHQPRAARAGAGRACPRARAGRLDTLHKQPKAPLEGAVVVTAPQSGDVIAIVGGRDVGYDGFDRALDAAARWALW